MRIRLEKQRTIPIQMYCMYFQTIFCEKLFASDKKTDILQQRKISPMKMQGNWKNFFTEKYPEQAETGAIYGVRF